MTYGAETCTETKKTKQLLRIAEYIENNYNKTRLDRLKEWNSHVDRAECHRLIRIAGDRHPPGRRFLGKNAQF
ncbi:hypothetical protein QE152_g34027 [Popillia japonica]|uniref:Uncharacterized protein n=1 Tax=Popillia japonica TaxID=7064 RepID=A0AAW1IV60_POPJA